MNLMTNDVEDYPRRRQVSPDALAGREAAALVRELNRQLGAWQAASVKLQTIAERLRGTGRHDPSVAAEAQALFHVVSAEAQRFESLLPGQRPAIVEHGRIKDTRRSFEMVTGRLRTSLKLLGFTPEGE